MGVQIVWLLYKTTKETFRRLKDPTCNHTTGCSTLRGGLMGSITSHIDVNTIDYDIEHNIVTSNNHSDETKNKFDLPNALVVLDRHDTINRNDGSYLKENKRKNTFDSVLKTTFSVLSKMIFTKSNRSNNQSQTKNSNNSFEDNFLLLPNSSVFLLINLTKTRISNEQHFNTSVKIKTSKDKLTKDRVSKTTIIKKRSINNGKDKLLPSSLKLDFDSSILKKSDRGFTFFRNSDVMSNEEIDPVSAIIDEEFILGGTHTGHEVTTKFPILDKDFDYNTEYDSFQLSNDPNHSESGSEESDTENKEEPYEESNEGKTHINLEPKDLNNVKSHEKNKGNKESKEGEEEEADDEDEEEVIREPPIIVLYKGGDSKQLQPSFEYALTHGGLDPRYIIKDPIAGPLATRGFNHHFQVMRGVPIQGNVRQQNGRYPLVGGFNTTQIHAIIQTGQFPPTTASTSNNTAVGVKPPAPADGLRYIQRPVTPEHFLPYPQPHPGYSNYALRPTTPPVRRPYYYEGRRRRPPPYVRQIKSPSTMVMSTPTYRGGRVMMRYYGTPGHVARYRPINVGVPRGTRMILTRRRRRTTVH